MLQCKYEFGIFANTLVYTKALRGAGLCGLTRVNILRARRVRVEIIMLRVGAGRSQSSTCILYAQIH